MMGGKVKKMSAEGQARGFVRTQSLPAKFDYIRAKKKRSSMKIATLDDSLHSTYGSDRYMIDSTNSAPTLRGSSDSLGSSTRGSNRVEFGEIQIREYGRTVGDNPSCSSGPPVSISWEYNPITQVLSVEEYEGARPRRRDNFEMILPRSVRTEILRKEWDVSQSEIASAVRSNIRIKSQRRATVNNITSGRSKTEEIIEKVARNVKRVLLFRKSTRAQLQLLQEQMEAAERARAQIIIDQVTDCENNQGAESSTSSPPPATTTTKEDAKPTTESSGDNVPTNNNRIQTVNVDTNPDKSQGSAAGSLDSSITAEDTSNRANDDTNTSNKKPKKKKVVNEQKKIKVEQAPPQKKIIPVSEKSVGDTSTPPAATAAGIQVVAKKNNTTSITNPAAITISEDDCGYIEF